jgi:osmotically-inducible protein OsmY
MTTKKLVALVILVALAVGCDNTNTNANANVSNSNRAVVTNNNANANANTNANANANANTKKAPSKEDVEKNKESYQKEAQGLGRKIGTGANDMWLWVKARYDLAAADDLRDSTINVDVDNAVVTLTGTVANAEQKTKAGQIAQSIEGVKSVKNELKVSADSNKNANANNSNTKKS